MYWHDFLQLGLGENSCTIKVKNLKKSALRKLDPASGKVARNWGKVGSVFGKLLTNLEKGWFSF